MLIHYKENEFESTSQIIYCHQSIYDLLNYQANQLPISLNKLFTEENMNASFEQLAMLLNEEKSEIILQLCKADSIEKISVLITIRNKTKVQSTDHNNSIDNQMRFVVLDLIQNNNEI